ncbi:hypothetical protein [Symbiobacterium terraclitae]|uniref:hypothetical protein n=1 Tax=Symbiobacterium terraclitae TaxID=557451 RepID=UPI0035B51FF8
MVPLLRRFLPRSRLDQLASELDQLDLAEPELEYVVNHVGGLGVKPLEPTAETVAWLIVHNKLSEATRRNLLKRFEKELRALVRERKQQSAPSHHVV